MAARPRNGPDRSDSATLVLADEHPTCRVLGPGDRYGIWVQGCPLTCRECVSPQWLPFDAGTPHPVEDVAARVVQHARDGLTISGGEPFSQAEALAELIDRIRTVRDLSVMSYTGHTLEYLRTRGTQGQQGLLDRLDLLVDGPYLPKRHADLAWRGSDNQRIHLLTDRHPSHEIPDRGVGLQVELTAERDVHWMGVPPTRGFLTKWKSLLEHGIQDPEGQ